jgi:hypothetical protein
VAESDELWTEDKHRTGKDHPLGPILPGNENSYRLYELCANRTASVRKVDLCRDPTPLPPILGRGETAVIFLWDFVVAVIR